MHLQGICTRSNLITLPLPLSNCRIAVTGRSTRSRCRDVAGCRPHPRAHGPRLAVPPAAACRPSAVRPHRKPRLRLARRRRRESSQWRKRIDRFGPLGSSASIEMKKNIHLGPFLRVGRGPPGPPSRSAHAWMLRHYIFCHFVL